MKSFIKKSLFPALILTHIGLRFILGGAFSTDWATIHHLEKIALETNTNCQESREANETNLVNVESNIEPILAGVIVVDSENSRELY